MTLVVFEAATLQTEKSGEDTKVVEKTGTEDEEQHYPANNHSDATPAQFHINDSHEGWTKVKTKKNNRKVKSTSIPKEKRDNADKASEPLDNSDIPQSGNNENEEVLTVVTFSVNSQEKVDGGIYQDRGEFVKPAKENGYVSKKV
ncbi:hypothetical protein QQ045_001899 [Rhodiola kirilowii]